MPTKVLLHTKHNISYLPDFFMKFELQVTGSFTRDTVQLQMLVVINVINKDTERGS